MSIFDRVLSKSESVIYVDSVRLSLNQLQSRGDSITPVLEGHVKEEIKQAVILKSALEKKGFTSAECVQILNDHELRFTLTNLARIAISDKQFHKFIMLPKRKGRSGEYSDIKPPKFKPIELFVPEWLVKSAAQRNVKNTRGIKIFPRSTQIVRHRK